MGFGFSFQIYYYRSVHRHNPISKTQQSYEGITNVYSILFIHLHSSVVILEQLENVRKLSFRSLGTVFLVLLVVVELLYSLIHLWLQFLELVQHQLLLIS